MAKVYVYVSGMHHNLEQKCYSGQHLHVCRAAGDTSSYSVSVDASTSVTILNQETGRALFNTQNTRAPPASFEEDVFSQTH